MINGADPSPDRKKTRAELYHIILSSLETGNKWAKGEDGRLYRLEKGRYLPDDCHGTYLARRIVTLMKAWGVPLLSEEEFYVKIHSHLLRSSPLLWSSPPLNQISVKNGILDLTTLVLTPHDESWLSPVQIPVEWNPDADGPMWKDFLLSLFPDNHFPFIEEVIGACLTPERSVQTALWLKGGGSNGKSTFMMAVAEMLGKENVHSFDIQTLDRSPFSVAELYGKLLAIDYDTKNFSLENAHVFKKIISGDPVTAQRKFGHPFPFQPNCKMVYCGNFDPKSKDRSFGFLRRITIVPFLKTFDPELGGRFMKQEDILRNLGRGEEGSWILAQAIKGWQRLHLNGKYTLPDTVRDATDHYRLTQHPLSLWRLDHLTPSPSSTVLKRDVLERSNSWLEEKGYPKLEEKKLEKLMKTFFPSLKDEGKKAEAWKGVQLI